MRLAWSKPENATTNVDKHDPADTSTYTDDVTRIKRTLSLHDVSSTFGSGAQPAPACTSVQLYSMDQTLEHRLAKSFDLLNCADDARVGQRVMTHTNASKLASEPCLENGGTASDSSSTLAAAMAPPLRLSTESVQPLSSYTQRRSGATACPSLTGQEPVNETVLDGSTSGPAQGYFDIFPIQDGKPQDISLTAYHQCDKNAVLGAKSGGGAPSSSSSGRSSLGHQLERQVPRFLFSAGGREAILDDSALNTNTTSSTLKTPPEAAYTAPVFQWTSSAELSDLPSCMETPSSLVHMSSNGQQADTSATSSSQSTQMQGWPFYTLDESVFSATFLRAQRALTDVPMGGTAPSSGHPACLGLTQQPQQPLWPSILPPGLPATSSQHSSSATSSSFISGVSPESVPVRSHSLADLRSTFVIFGSSSQDPLAHQRVYPPSDHLLSMSTTGPSYISTGAGDRFGQCFSAPRITPHSFPMQSRPEGMVTTSRGGPPNYLPTSAAIGSTALAPDLSLTGLGQQSRCQTGANPFTALALRRPLQPQSLPIPGGSYRPEFAERPGRSGTASPNPATLHADSAPLRVEVQEENGKRRLWYRASNGQFASANSLAKKRQAEEADGPSSSHLRRIRKRRKGDEIDRKYVCNYPGCNKGYGTLNHLNTHRSGNDHGPRLNAAAYRAAAAAAHDAVQSASGRMAPPS